MAVFHLAFEMREEAQREAAPLVAIIDDDQMAQLSTRCLLESEGFRVLSFESGDEYLSARLHEIPACLLLDIQMPGLDGIETLRRLAERRGSPPILVVSARAHLDVAVEAMKLGAADFIQKPYAPKDLLRALRGISNLDERSQEDAREREMARLVEGLTPRQKQVLAGLVRGLPNKIIAWELKLSIRTVEDYRASLFRRLGVRSVAEAVRIAMEAGLEH